MQHIVINHPAYTSNIVQLLERFEESTGTSATPMIKSLVDVVLRQGSRLHQYLPLLEKSASTLDIDPNVCSTSCQHIVTLLMHRSQF